MSHLPVAVLSTLVVALVVVKADVATTTTSYGVDVSYPMQSLGFDNSFQPFGNDAQERYEKFMNGCREHYSKISEMCDNNEQGIIIYSFVMKEVG